MIYFDNAATSFPKPRGVIRSINECIKEYCGNPGRSSHYLSRKSEEVIYKTRELVSALVGLDAPERVVFTMNATHALNLSIKCSVPENSHVLISDIEHNSVIRPLHALSRERGVSYSVFSVKGNVRDSVMPLIKENTHTVICNLLSNVTGEEPNISALSEICRREGLTFIADASQKIGHSSIDVKKIGCDILCAPAHKALFGVQGAGFAVIYNDKLIRTFCEGGSGSESKKPSMPQYLPERFEAGTLPTPSIAALGAGIEFINSVGVEAIDKKIKLLTAALFDRLSERSYISYLSGANGVISFTVKGISPSRISELLDSYGICVRSGLHCAPLVHIREGTDKEGCVRVSFSYFNKLHEIDDFITTLDKIAKAYK